MASQKINEFQRVLVLGDSTIENKLPHIKGLWKAAESSPLLGKFLQQAFEIIQNETLKLNSSEGILFLHCINILEVAEVYAEMNEPDEIIASILVLVARLGELVLDSERNSSTIQSQDPVHILGFCTGLLPGAVAACTKDTVTTFALCREMVAISFRLVITLTRRSQAIEQVAGLWATTMVGISREELQARLNKFNVDESLPAEKRAYIGVTQHSWNTVFGPPSVIEKVSSTNPLLNEISQIKTTAAMAVHATHLPQPDINYIIGNSTYLNTPILPTASIISTSTGQKFAARTLSSLLRLIIDDIATRLLDIDRTIQGITVHLDKSKPVRLLAIGPSPNVLTIKRTMLKMGFKNVDTDEVLEGSRTRRLVPQGKISMRGYRGTRPTNAAVPLVASKVAVVALAATAS